MSGIVGSKLNIRGSGLVAKLGTDGQLFTSSGAGVSQAFETAAGGGGKILQVVNAIKTDTSLISTSWTDISDLEVAITPSDTSSKIYINCNVMAGGGKAAFIKLLRDIGGGGYADSTFIGESASNRIRCSCWTGVTDAGYVCGNIGYLDTTNTTSEVTYKLQGLASQAGTYKQLGINIDPGDDGDTTGYGRAASSITAYEIGA